VKRLDYYQGARYIREKKNVRMYLNFGG